MIKEIKIESNVPMIKHGGHASAKKHGMLYDTFDAMDVSQSIVLDNLTTIAALRAYAYNKGKKICYRKVDNQAWRVWRKS